MATRLISIDCGKSNTKVCEANIDSIDKIHESMYPTTVVDYNELSNLDIADGTHIKSKELGIDKMVGCSTNDGRTQKKNSKNDDIHKIATLCAIASNVNNADIVNVVIGCPLSEFINKEKCEAYKNNILPKGEISVEVDGKTKTFTIDKRLVLPESTGVVAMHTDLFVRNVAIIDIGGLNTNAVQMHNGSLIAQSSITNQNGERLLKDELARVLESANEELRLNDIMLEDAIKYGYVEFYEDLTRPLIEKTIEKYLNTVMESLKGTSWDSINLMKLIFVGGTSSILKPYIKKKFGKRAIVFDDNESIFMNARGFFIQAKNKILKEEKNV